MGVFETISFFVINDKFILFLIIIETFFFIFLIIFIIFITSPDFVEREREKRGISIYHMTPQNNNTPKKNRVVVVVLLFSLVFLSSL